MVDFQAPCVHLFARFPHAGVAKTRLIPRIGADGAAEVHRTLVERTIATVTAAGLPLVIQITGAPLARFEHWLGDRRLVEQGEGDLGERLARVPAPAILLGADIPGLRPAHLLTAAEALRHHPVAIGPASDGGYYLLAYRDPVPFLFDDMPWGTDAVYRETYRRLEVRGLDAHVLPTLDDCDRPEDLDRWPDLLS